MTTPVWRYRQDKETILGADSYTMDTAALVSLARYERAQAHIRRRIVSGQWRPGDRIPSEQTRVRGLGVSR